MLDNYGTSDTAALPPSTRTLPSKSEANGSITESDSEHLPFAHNASGNIDKCGLMASELKPRRLVMHSRPSSCSPNVQIQMWTRVAPLVTDSLVYPLSSDSQQTPAFQKLNHSVQSGSIAKCNFEAL